MQVNSPNARRLYGPRWRRLRADYLRRNPICVEHRRLGFVVVANIVDHKIPHKGDQVLFWSESNWQALCKTCHDSWKQASERGVTRSGCSANGMPTDPSHHWNQG